MSVSSGAGAALISGGAAFRCLRVRGVATPLRHAECPGRTPATPSYCRPEMTRRPFESCGRDQWSPPSPQAELPGSASASPSSPSARCAATSTPGSNRWTRATKESMPWSSPSPACNATASPIGPRRPSPRRPHACHRRRIRDRRTSRRRPDRLLKPIDDPAAQRLLRVERGVLAAYDEAGSQVQVTAAVFGPARGPAVNVRARACCESAGPQRLVEDCDQHGRFCGSKWLVSASAGRSRPSDPPRRCPRPGGGAQAAAH